MKIGDRIQYLRKRANLTQAELAEKMNVSFQTISGWERDEYLPETNRILELAECLNVTITNLFETEILHKYPAADRLFDEEHMYTFIKASAAMKGYCETSCALPFARDKHKGQFRKCVSPVPYINHPLTMACHALSMNLEDDVIAACLLHDVCEDCATQPTELPVSVKIQQAVSLLTFSVQFNEAPAEAMDRYYSAMTENPIASVVKAIDRCNNLSTMAMGFSRDKMREYIIETETYILPLIENIKNRWPNYYNATFLLKYQIKSLIEMTKHTLA